MGGYVSELPVFQDAFFHSADFLQLKEDMRKLRKARCSPAAHQALACSEETSRIPRRRPDLLLARPECYLLPPYSSPESLPCQTEVSDVVGPDAMRTGVDPLLLAKLNENTAKIDAVGVQVEEVRRLVRTYSVAWLM